MSRVLVSRTFTMAHSSSGCTKNPLLLLLVAVVVSCCCSNNALQLSILYASGYSMTTNVGKQQRTKATSSIIRTFNINGKSNLSSYSNNIFGSKLTTTKLFASSSPFDETKSSNDENIGSSAMDSDTWQNVLNDIWSTEPSLDVVSTSATPTYYSTRNFSSRSTAADDDTMDTNDSTYEWLATSIRVLGPSTVAAIVGKLTYPAIALALAAYINDSGVFAVVSQDASQYIQNICTTSGLMFAILAGQTYYFMYQQQESIYHALYQEVSCIKMLLEQVALTCAGRDELYKSILRTVDNYVRDDLCCFNEYEPAVLLSQRPCDDPLESILYQTSVGVPSVTYSTAVRQLRQARAMRLGALQKKLPSIHMMLLWVLYAIVLFTFPLLGAGVQTIGGEAILVIQSYYIGILLFGMTMVMGIIYELQSYTSATYNVYSAKSTLNIMISGIQSELYDRLNN